MKSYNSSRPVCTFYDQIHMAGNIAHLRRHVDHRAFLHALCARPDFKQQEKKKKKVLEIEREETNAGTTDT